MAGNRHRSSGSASDYSPHQNTAMLGDLPKILGRELREHYELPHELPHGMFTLLTELKNLDRSPALEHGLRPNITRILNS
jgi:hypothetical protein